MSLLSTLNTPSQSRAWFTAAHPTLPIVATCFSDKSVRVYSLVTHTLLSTISGGHKRAIRTCAWKPNLKSESVIATGSFDASVGIWRHSDEEEREVDVSRLVESEQTEEEEEDSDGWRFAIVLDGHESEVKSVSWSAGGNFLASCSRDKSIWIWEEIGEDDFETVAVMTEHEGDVKCVSWHPEEELLASGSYDNDIRLWREEDDWGCVEILRGHESTVWCLDWEKPHGERLCSCSGDLTLRIWSKSTSNAFSEEIQLPQRHERAIYAVAWSTDGRIASTGGDGRIVIYKEFPSTTEVAPTNERQTRSDKAVDDGKMLKEEGDDGEVSNSTKPSAQRTNEWRVITVIEKAHGLYEINHLCWASRGQGEEEDVIVTAGDDGTIKVWDPSPME